MTAACDRRLASAPTLPQVERAKVLSNTIKQKRKEKAGKWEVPLPKVSAGARTLVTGCCWCSCR